MGFFFVLIKRDIYALEEHKMMQKILQNFIKNDIIDHINAWGKNGMVSRGIWERAGVCSKNCFKR